MNTILVPVNFSETAHNAALYAAALAQQIGEVSVLLYHSCIATNKDGEPAATMYEAAQAQMEHLVASLKSVAPDTAIANVINDGLLLENIKNLSAAHPVMLVVMGITGKNKVEQKLIGSNTTKVSLESGLPVLIIPAQYSFTPIDRVVLALQLKNDLLETVPYQKINQLLHLLQAQLMVVNVADGESDTPNQYVYAGQQAAHIMFDAAGATYHMLSERGVEQSLKTFAIENKAQVIVSIAQHHNFFELLFEGSLTDKLAFQADLPVLAIRANAKV